MAFYIYFFLDILSYTFKQFLKNICRRLFLYSLIPAPMCSISLCLHFWYLIKFKWSSRTAAKSEFSLRFTTWKDSFDRIHCLPSTELISLGDSLQQETHCATLFLLEPIFVVWTTAVMLNKNREEFLSYTLLEGITLGISNITHFWPKSIINNLPKHPSTTSWKVGSAPHAMESWLCQ